MLYAPIFLYDLRTFYLMFCRYMHKSNSWILSFFFFFGIIVMLVLKKKELGSFMEHQNSSLESLKEFSLTWEQRASSWAFTECLTYLGPPHLRSHRSWGTYIPGLSRESTKTWPPHPSWDTCEGPLKPQSSWHCPAPIWLLLLSKFAFLYSLPQL